MRMVRGSMEPEDAKRLYARFLEVEAQARAARGWRRRRLCRRMWKLWHRYDYGYRQNYPGV